MVGSRFSTLTVHLDRVLGIRVNTGCFSGDVHDFRYRVSKVHENNDWRTLYPRLLRALVDIVASAYADCPNPNVDKDLVKAAVAEARKR
jgi:hypothetical protein